MDVVAFPFLSESINKDMFSSSFLSESIDDEAA